MKRCLFLVCAVSVVAAAAPPVLVKVNLLDVGFGPTTQLLAGSTPPAVMPFAVGDVALGLMVSNHVGVGIGTALSDGYFLGDISSMPVHGFVFYDFSPGQRWRRAMGFASVTYVYNEQDGWSGNATNPYWKLACGASYTWYVLTPHAELGYDWHERFATLTAGVAIGGTYVFQQ